METLKRFLREEDGATMAEYAVILAVIVAVGIAVFTNLGTAIQTRVNAVISALK